MQRMAISLRKSICVYKYPVTWHRRIARGRGRENAQGNSTFRWVFPFPVAESKKKRLRRSPNPSPGPRARSVRPKPFLTDVAITWSSKCPFAIPWLQPSLLLVPMPWPYSAANFQSRSSSSLHHQGKTSQSDLLRLIRVPFRGRHTCVDMPEQLAPIPEKSIPKSRPGN